MRKNKPGPDAEVSFEVEERLFPAQAVQAAAYAFTDRVYARFEPAREGVLKLVLAFKGETPAAARQALDGEFRNELLHQALRLRVSEANQKIREFIVTKALVSAQPAGVAAASREDVPCEECAAPTAPSEAPAPLDAELEKEIARLLTEIEGGDGAADPLGVAVPWEEKFGEPGAKPGSVTERA